MERRATLAAGRLAALLMIGLGGPLSFVSGSPQPLLTTGAALEPVASAAARASIAAARQELPSSADDADPALQALADFVSKKKISTKASDWKSRVPAPPALPFDPWSEYRWHARTNVGDMSFRLFPDSAPKNVASLIHLTRLGFFDGTPFHRVMSDFMAQGGCPLGTGNGDPGYRLPDEFSDDVRHELAGRLSAANAGPNTAGSQFFVTFGPMPHLDDVHTIYGELLEGESTLRALNAGGSSDGTPKRELRLERATVTVQPLTLPRSEDTADPALATLREAARGAVVDRNKRWRLALPEPPEVEFEAGREWRWHLLTDVGPLVVRLDPEAAPLQTASVVYLTSLGFYAGLDFFKVSKGQGLHAACPRGNGRSFPGYKLEQQIDESRVHARGSFSAPQVSKGLEGSQFFVALGEASRLDGRATIFGQLVEGEDTLARLEALVKGSKLTQPVALRAASIELR